MRTRDNNNRSDISPLKKEGRGEDLLRVFAVIPVFNRLQFTLDCIECLKRQTYIPLDIIVVDGGSTDGTVETLRQEHPDVIVLGGDRELWWAGAMEVGINHALSMSSNDNDMILMMNNDTIVHQDYVETLVEASRLEKAAVGALIVDSADPTHILDAGEMIDWENYKFPVRTEINSSETFYDGVDILPGRGSLIPIYMINKAGNVDARRFPHYLADYDFFCRLRRNGFRLGVCYAARNMAHIHETGIIPTSDQLSFAELWRELTARKSMVNFRDHWRFIRLNAPEKYRRKNQLRILSIVVYMLCMRTKLSIFFCFFWRLYYTFIHEFNQVNRFPRVIRWPIFFFLIPYPVTIEECRVRDLDPEELVRKRILEKVGPPGWYSFVSFRQAFFKGYKTSGLFFKAWNPLAKPYRWLRLRRDYQAYMMAESNGNSEVNSFRDSGAP